MLANRFGDALLSYQNQAAKAASRVTVKMSHGCKVNETAKGPVAPTPAVGPNAHPSDTAILEPAREVTKNWYRPRRDAAAVSTSVMKPVIACSVNEKSKPGPLKEKAPTASKMDNKEENARIRSPWGL
jgi:hypothetical protein